ncbi:hypothetical protein HFO88_28465 [Rhizobium leguminosarum]|uniref:hypothetical protein n=1 Tax=Rhizobium TaxID=379 RepID=UPI00160F38DA|nr:MULTISPECIES: hypothetical protein [Rhizobium]MBY5904235.1 hypothetical protein [Rhizobium leguminosarum]MBY5911604.1 hypothetical protein [Rhizobium leguminosarum]
MDIGHLEWEAVDPSTLDSFERQNVVRHIVDELQEICDRDAASGGGDRYPALNRLLQTIRASTLSIASADDDCFQRIVDELLQLRATMTDRRADEACSTYN